LCEVPAIRSVSIISSNAYQRATIHARDSWLSDLFCGRDVHGPFKDFPAVVVYHPSGNNSGHPFVNVGFVGWIASLTGISSVQLAISHIGV
jgi:hypothetical protein